MREQWTKLVVVVDAELAQRLALRGEVLLVG